MGPWEGHFRQAWVSWAASIWSQLTNHEARESAYLPGGSALLRGLAEEEADLLEGPCECVSGCHDLGSALAVCPCRDCSVRWSIAGLEEWAGGRASFEKCRRVTSVVGTGLEVDFGSCTTPAQGCTDEPPPTGRQHEARYRGTQVLARCPLPAQLCKLG